MNFDGGFLHIALAHETESTVQGRTSLTTQREDPFRLVCFPVGSKKGSTQHSEVHIELLGDVGCRFMEENTPLNIEVVYRSKRWSRPIHDDWKVPILHYSGLIEVRN